MAAYSTFYRRVRGTVEIRRGGGLVGYHNLKIKGTWAMKKKRNVQRLRSGLIYNREPFSMRDVGKIR